MYNEYCFITVIFMEVCPTYTLKMLNMFMASDMFFFLHPEIFLEFSLWVWSPLQVLQIPNSFFVLTLRVGALFRSSFTWNHDRFNRSSQRWKRGRRAIASRIWSVGLVMRLVQGETCFFTTCTPQEAGIFRSVIGIPFLSSRDGLQIYIFCSRQVVPNPPQEARILSEHLCI